MSKLTVEEINSAIADLDNGFTSFATLLDEEYHVQTMANANAESAKTKAEKADAEKAITDAANRVANFINILGTYTDAMQELYSVRDKVTAGENVETHSLTSEESDTESDSENGDNATPETTETTETTPETELVTV